MKILTFAARFSVALLAVMTCLTAVTGSAKPSKLQQIREDGRLVVVTLNSPMTYFDDRSGSTGYEYELAQGFADFLGVKLEIVVEDSIEDVFKTLETGHASLAAASLAISADRQRWFRFSSPYMKVSELVVYKRGTSKPRA
ncbi:MAG: transporter substrate-binding domain-containing protein, partial [Oceanobacter sp.]